MDVLVITHFLNGLLMIALPILLGIYLINKFHLSGRFWWIGAGTFIISQVFHLPFNTYLLNPFLLEIQQTYQGIAGLILIALLLGLSAGIFEESARYCMYRWWARDARTWRSGILAGAGHGGIEAILLGILVLISFLNMMVYRNQDLSRLNLTINQLQIASQQLQAYWNAPWYMTLLGAVERVFTIPFHIAASLLVLQVFTRHEGHQQIRWLLAAILYHAFADAAGVFVARQWGAYIAEAALGLLAVLAVIIIFAFRRAEPELPLPPSKTVVVKLPDFKPTPIEESSDNLEKTRYQ